MKVTRHPRIITLLLGALSLTYLTACGRSTTDPDPGTGGTSIPGTGGITAQGGALGGGSGQGGNAGAGGSGGSQTSTTGVNPRPPTSHRTQASSCVGVNSPSEPNNPNPSPSSTCKRHADCTSGTNGKCISGIGSAGSHYYCVYDQCATDADCETGKVCHCNSSTAARCLSVGNCRTDADCGAGSYGYCSPSMGMDCGGNHSIDSYHCHTPADSCMDDSDCTYPDYCNYNEYDGRWKCTPPNRNCVIG